MIIKLNVAEEYLGKPLKNVVFIAGYVNGSTRGFACQLLLYFLTHCRRPPWLVPEVQAALESFTRIKVNIVFHPNAISRAQDAMRAPCVDYVHVCSCLFMSIPVRSYLFTSFHASFPDVLSCLFTLVSCCLAPPARSFRAPSQV